MKHLRVWHLEQIVLFFLVALATWAQLRLLRARGPLTLEIVVPVLGSALSTLVAQKVRSGADRQREEDALRGVQPSKIECAKAQALWGAVLQALMFFMGIALAPTLWSVPVALYATLYSILWRPAYRVWIRPRRRRLRVA